MKLNKKIFIILFLILSFFIFTNKSLAKFGDYELIKNMTFIADDYSLCLSDFYNSHSSLQSKIDDFKEFYDSTDYHFCYYNPTAYGTYRGFQFFCSDSPFTCSPDGFSQDKFKIYTSGKYVSYTFIFYNYLDEKDYVNVTGSSSFLTNTSNLTVMSKSDPLFLDSPIKDKESSDVVFRRTGGSGSGGSSSGGSDNTNTVTGGNQEGSESSDTDSVNGILGFVKSIFDKIVDLPSLIVDRIQKLFYWALGYINWTYSRYNRLMSYNF